MGKKVGMWWRVSQRSVGEGGEVLVRSRMMSVGSDAQS